VVKARAGAGIKGWCRDTGFANAASSRFAAVGFEVREILDAVLLAGATPSGVRDDAVER